MTTPEQDTSATRVFPAVTSTGPTPVTGPGTGPMPIGNPLADMLSELFYADLVSQFRAAQFDAMHHNRLGWFMHPKWLHLAGSMNDSYGQPLVQRILVEPNRPMRAEYAIFGFPVFSSTKYRIPELRYP